MDSNELGTDNYMLKHLSLVPATLCCANYSASSTGIVSLPSPPFTANQLGSWDNKEVLSFIN